MGTEHIKVMLIADVDADGDHTAVEGLFKDRARIGVQCLKIFFSKSARQPEVRTDRIVLPYIHKRRGLQKALRGVVDLESYRVVVVRNIFSVLEQFQKNPSDVLLGFWESFPHSHRRLEQAHLEKRAVWRKRIEYHFAKRRERRLIAQCDFYLPITRTHKDIFYPDLRVPFHATPIGFDFERFPLQRPSEKKGPIRFVYIGTVDSLRRLDIVNRAFLSQKDEFRLDYYTGSQNKAVDHIRAIDDPRIRLHTQLPQHELFQKIAAADVGVCFFPHTKTYITASPIKTLEYGAQGLSVLVNPMPEYNKLINSRCAYICDFDEGAIKEQIALILRSDRSEISLRGQHFQKRVFQQRNYGPMAEQLFRFIQGQLTATDKHGFE